MSTVLIEHDMSDDDVKNGNFSRNTPRYYSMRVTSSQSSEIGATIFSSTKTHRAPPPPPSLKLSDASLSNFV